MGVLADADWPPTPILTSRLTLRETKASDCYGDLELLTSEEVRRHWYLGGALPRDEVARAMPDVPGRYPGVFAVDLAGEFVGAVMVERRSLDRAGHVLDVGDESELSFTLLPPHWGRGYAHEASEAVLDWIATAFPGEPVLLCTQSANVRSLRLAERLGFVQVASLNEFGAEQWLGVRWPVSRLDHS